MRMRHWPKNLTINQILNNKELFKTFKRSNGKYFKQFFPEWSNQIKEKINWIKNDNFLEILWCYLNNLQEYPKCPICKNDITEFYRFQGYKQTCSKKCSNIQIQNKAQKTCLKRYGVKKPSQNKQIREKNENNMLKKYNTKYAFQLPKTKTTMIKKYGSEYALQSEICKEKFKQTSLNKFGTTHPMKSEICKENLKNTFIKKYGISNPFKLESTKEKFKQTMLEKYGVEHPMHSAEIITKQQKTAFKRKEYILPSGKIIYIQGYEPQALNILLKQYKENDIITSKKEIEQLIGKIWYIENNKKHRYYPDFYIKSKNLIIEVKSNWTYNNEIIKNKLKEQATLNLNLNFEFIIL